MRNKFLRMFSGSLLATAIALAICFAFLPEKTVAQVFAPCSTYGCTMRGNILYSGAAPTVSGTGTPTVASGSTNTAGSVTAGASATSVVITFANGGYSTVPFCQVQSETQLAAWSYTVSATAITITQTSTSGNIIIYECNPSS